jgi:hypothetical protein
MRKYIETGIQAANSIVSEPDIWTRDSALAQAAIEALWDV